MTEATIIPFNKVVRSEVSTDTLIKNISVRSEYYGKKGDKILCGNGHVIGTLQNDCNRGGSFNIDYTDNSNHRNHTSYGKDGVIHSVSNTICKCGAPWVIGNFLLFEDGLRVYPDFDIETLEVV